MATASPQSPATTASPEKRPQGSGRFTNLQKYLQANQGAGQRIAGQVGTDVRKDVQEGQQQAQDYYSKLGQAVQQAQDVAQQGAGYTQALRDISGNIASAQSPGQVGLQQFTQDPGFQQFQNIQAGRGIDEGLLNLRRSQAEQSAQDYLSQAAQARQALGSEAGRFDLLRQTFGGADRPGYTTGQQRLDQLFLAQQGLGGLQRQLGEDVRSSQQLAKEAQLRGQAAGRLVGQEQDLMSEIGQLGGQIESGYYDLLEQKRQQLAEQAPQQLESFKQRLADKKLTAEDIANLGLNPGQQLFGVNLSDLVKGVGTINPTLQQATSPEELARYQAAAQIAGVDPRIAESQQQGFSPYKLPLDTIQSQIEQGRNVFAQEFAPLAKTSENYGQLANLASGLNVRQIQSRDFIQKAANLGFDERTIGNLMSKSSLDGMRQGISFEEAFRNNLYNERNKLREQAMNVAQKRGALQTLAGYAPTLSQPSDGKIDIPSTPTQYTYQDLLSQFAKDIYGAEQPTGGAGKDQSDPTVTSMPFGGAGKGY